MQLYSTNQNSPLVNMEEAIFQGLPPDNGLYMPIYIPSLPISFWENSPQMTFTEIALEIANAFFEEEIPREALKGLIDEALTFDAPLVELDKNLYCLELFHGPSMAFKDFGARFMSAIMSYFLARRNKKIHILVATSGDTGGAVAQGFFGNEHIDVHILYPKGKVSDIQEKQLTTLGQNVHALEVNGTFDDCQKLVKTAFLDSELRAKYALASANSINIARLIPQTFYYAYAFSRLKTKGLPIVFAVPSGNFGNLAAGIIANRMGMPVSKFVAATNANSVVPKYLDYGVYFPISPSISTISNAMDVGDPSNFPRLLALCDEDHEEMQALISGLAYSDDKTRKGMKEMYEKYNYLACPHTAVAYLGLQEFLMHNRAEVSGVFLSTAHYAKFLNEVEPVIGNKLPIPERLEGLLEKKKEALSIETDYASFRAYLESL